MASPERTAGTIKQLINGDGPWLVQLGAKFGALGLFCAATMWALNEYNFKPAREERAAAATERKLFVETLTTGWDKSNEERQKLTNVLETMSESFTKLDESIQRRQAFEDGVNELHQKQTTVLEETNEVMHRAEALMAPVPEERREFYQS